MNSKIIEGFKNTFSKAVGRPLRPRWLWFGATDKCNSHCMQCNIWRQTPTKDMLTPQEVERTLRDPLFLDVECILNSGGEITLRPDLKELMLAEHSALPNALIQLSTNGLLPDKMLDAVRFGLERKMRISVGTSIDGIGSAHDEIRGVPGNFEKVTYLLEQLAKIRETDKNLDIGFGFTLMDKTLPNLESVRAYAEKMKIGFLMQWYNQSSFYSNTSGAADTRADFRAAVKTYPDKILREMWLDWLDKKPIRFNCFAMNTFCVLKCNGDIVPCLSKWDTVAGNVRKNTPTEIWNSGDAKSARKAVNACAGCLNAWGTEWSFISSRYPYKLFYLTHPSYLVKKLTGLLGGVFHSKE